MSEAWEGSGRSVVDGFRRKGDAVQGRRTRVHSKAAFLQRTVQVFPLKFCRISIRLGRNAIGHHTGATYRKLGIGRREQVGEVIFDKAGMASGGALVLGR